jgi:RNA polymerase sigma-70 factor, ECF subfamily
MSVKPNEAVEAALGGYALDRTKLLMTMLAWHGSKSEEFDVALNALATLASNGNPLALELLLLCIHRLGLARIAINRITADPSIVDDAAQATLVSVQRHISTFEGRSLFRTWLSSVARNETLGILRKRIPEPTQSATDGGALGLHHQKGTMSSVIATRHTIEKLVADLPEPYQTTLRLQIYDGLEYNEIAGRLRVPIGTVRSRLAKARLLLRPHLGVYGEPEPRHD